MKADGKYDQLEEHPGGLRACS